MTKLLVSVRSGREAKTALTGGADLIDVKEPRRGSLGPADPRVWAHVRSVLGADRPLSVALGELLTDNVAVAAARAQGVQFAKIGLAGCAGVADWEHLWRLAFDRLPNATCRVAVAYADHPAARAPQPRDVASAAQRVGCRALLVDTFDKNGPGLLGHLSETELARLSALGREHGMLIVLAGALDEHSLERVCALAPDYVAVRGAACLGHRSARVDQAQVRQLAELVRSSSTSERIPH